jgi:alkylation response protein AidB-like acyl-CoA dehydrogenase
MDFDLPPEDDPHRLVVRAWLGANPHPTGHQLAAAGYVVPQWPPPWGLGADPVHRLIIDDELDRAGVRRPGGIGIGWAAPTLLVAGTPEQQQRFLPGILSGEDQWCQLFSEPDAGSDLAGLTTRAERDGDEYVVTGAKIWSSGAHHSRYGILLARTDSDAPVATDSAPGSPSRQAGRNLQRKHRGISFFVCPMDLPGITLRPIVDMTTAHSFNQVFFDGLRLPASLRVGDEGAGWRLAKVTLSNERVMLSSSGSLWGSGPSAAMLLDLVRAHGGVSDRRLRERLAMLHCEAEVLRLNRLRTLSAGLAGRTPGPEASIQKIMADEHGQHVMELAKDLAGPAGMLEGSGPAGDVPEPARTGPTEVNVKPDHFPGVDPIWHYGFLFAPALTLGGGTFAIQRNIVAEMVLGLPRDPRPA